MCAQIALSGSKYDELINVESIYDAYYTPVLKNVLPNYENRLLIKVLAIISFYKIVDLAEESLLRQIESIFGITASEFINTCHALERLECIDITEEDIATISDQNFSNYIFYQYFFALKETSLSYLIEKLYLRRDRLSDSIFSVWNCFHKDQVIEYLKTSVSTAWDNILNSNDAPKDKDGFLELFGTLISSKTFVYVKRLIEEFEVNTSKFPMLSCDSVISILSPFSHSQEWEIKAALTLIVKYLKVNPSEIEKTEQIISEYWVYDDTDYVTSYKRSTTIIDALIGLAQESEVGFKLASKILPDYLKFSYQINETKGRKFMFGRYPVFVTNELKLNRKKVWEWIVSNISNMNQQALIKDLYVDLYEVKSIARELVLEEITFLNEAISKLNINDDFNLCSALNDFSKRVAHIISKDNLVIDWNHANPLYTLDCQIKKNCKRRIARQYEVEKKNIGNIVKSKSFTELQILIDNIAQIADLQNTDGAFRISYVIEEVMLLDLSIALQLWQYSINKGYNYIASRILSTYFSSEYDIHDLITFIKRQNQETKSNLLLEFVCCIDNPSLYISVQDFHNALIGYSSICYNVNFIVKKFFSADKLFDGIRMVMAAILRRTRKGQDISGTEIFLQEFCVRYPSKFHLIEYAYIYELKQRNNYDYEQKLLKDILRLDPYFWVMSCTEIKAFVKDCHIEPYKFIWDLDNYSQIIESTLLYYGNKSWIPYDEKGNLFSFFCNIGRSEAADFIESMIIKHCKNRHLLRILFEIVISNMGNTKIQHFVTFISHNDNIEDFKLLGITPRTMYGGDSFATAVKANLDFVSALIDKISSFKSIKYLEHLHYLTKKKEAFEKKYKYELKRGHKNRLYDL